MKLDIGGNETIQAPVEALWIALNDPEVLTRCVPGCKSMTEIAPDAYKVEMQLRVAAVGGSFEGEIALSDKEPPKTCSIKVSGAGTLGHGNGTRALRNRAGRRDASRLIYQGHRRNRRPGRRRRPAHPRSVSKHLIGRFFVGAAQGIRAADQRCGGIACRFEDAGRTSDEEKRFARSCLLPWR